MYSLKKLPALLFIKQSIRTLLLVGPKFFAAFQAFEKHCIMLNLNGKYLPECELRSGTSRSRTTFSTDLNSAVLNSKLFQTSKPQQLLAADSGKSRFDPKKRWTKIWKVLPQNFLTANLRLSELFICNLNCNWKNLASSDWWRLKTLNSFESSTNDCRF